MYYIKIFEIQTKHIVNCRISAKVQQGSPFKLSPQLDFLEGIDFGNVTFATFGSVPLSKTAAKGPKSTEDAPRRGRELSSAPPAPPALVWGAGAAHSSAGRACARAVAQRQKHIIATGYRSLPLSAAGGMEMCPASKQMHRRSFSVDTSQLTLSRYFSICFTQVKMIVCNKMSIPCFATMPYPSRRIVF